jgi:CheY-like chemotaxis protein
MQAILEKAGHTVVAVADGHRAVEAIGKNAFDLLCTDAVMPGEPVRQVVDAFVQRHPQGRVLIASGHADDELTRRGLEQGRYRLLRKPFLPPDLCAAVDELLERARAA